MKQTFSVSVMVLDCQMLMSVFVTRSSIDQAIYSVQLNLVWHSTLSMLYPD